MNQEYFLRELEKLLADLEADEREEVLRYYRDLFAEAGPEQEAEILRHLGDPEKVAAEIREGLKGDPDAGEFTEQGYRDERFDDVCLAPERYAQVDSSKRKNGLMLLILLLVLFLVFGLPLAGTALSAGVSIFACLIGCVFSVLIGLLALVFGGFVSAIVFAISGILLVVVGFFNLTAPAMGLMLMCFGFLMLAAAMLLIVAAKWGCTTAIPGVFRFSVNLARSVCGWIGRALRRMFGKGGAAA